jgi:hypothetical protein
MNIEGIKRRVYGRYKLFNLWFSSVLGKCFFEQKGWCPICEHKVIFRSKSAWFRDHLLCSECASIPRERALMSIIKLYYPDYRCLKIHESSPGYRGVSVKLKTECKSYKTSHYYQDLEPGETHPVQGHRCENLEDLTFEDESFDLFITQDVMEHVFDSEKAFKEIARVLKLGGAHIFTVPIINKERATECWASRDSEGVIHYHQAPEYHGNPIDKHGSLVTMHWGYDIGSFVKKVAGMPTVILTIDNISEGIRAKYIDVVVSRKS